MSQINSMEFQDSEHGKKKLRLTIGDYFYDPW